MSKMESDSSNRLASRQAADIGDTLAGDASPSSHAVAAWPPWLTEEPPIDDSFDTESSMVMQETADECLPLLLGISRSAGNSRDGVPPLFRELHTRFLARSLGKLPAPFVGLDASRPWMFYWCITAFSSLGEDPSKFRHDLITSLRAIQNASGGFGGGHGQYSHLATTYAAVLSLATVGGQEAYDLIDRRAMWHWLGRLKQPTGEFEVCEGGEKDVRGALCAMVLVTLLNLPLELPGDSPARAAGHETLTSGLADWISRCQTYEGGLGSEPGAEAHGAYTFCGLACLCILGDPRVILAKYLDMSDLVRWLSARQHAPEGGLAGRTNKLVDNCYSHWLGGCWALVEAAGLTPHQQESKLQHQTESLFNREALIRYILCCGQAERGGLRDKPSKPPDAYHTQYGLAGLSSAQNYYTYDAAIQDTASTILPAAFKWSASTSPQAESAADDHKSQIFNEGDRVSLLHPVYVIPWTAADKMASYFKDKFLT